MAAEMLRTIYRMLIDGTFYEENRVKPREPTAQEEANRLIRRLARIGFAAEIKPLPSPAPRV